MELFMSFLALPMNVYSFDATTEGTRVSLDHTAMEKIRLLEQ
jgi:hypothetical protein